jgi:YYY domain-containing protein
MSKDIIDIFEWWTILFGIGIIFLPITTKLFFKFFDKGYIFAKTIGIAAISYLVFIFGTFHILPFSQLSVFIVILILLISNLFFVKSTMLLLQRKNIFLFIFEELLFLLSFIFWAYIKSFQPDIHGLEKFMDFGFINSILRSTYFPPVDMWFPPLSINYYYFGHLVTAVLIKLSGISPFVAFNLMLSTIFAFTITSSFSIVSTLSNSILKSKKTSILSGILGGILTALGGNLHTLYTLFTPYSPPANPQPFWHLTFNPLGFPNNYWYPNATRFIPFTIHEFPSYSFVVSDLHGHVLDIPFVFLTIALIYSIFKSKKVTVLKTIIISFMLSVMYMTNAWDGIIYFGLFSFTVLFFKSSTLKIIIHKKFKWGDFRKIKIENKIEFIISSLKYVVLAGVGFLVFSFPFGINFKPFVSGIGVICAPNFLTSIGKIGPFLFEPNHCQRSPLWMLAILYGFFYIFSISLLFKIVKLKRLSSSFIFILLLIFISTLLIITPEFIYAKDIYPDYYRANTMFKLCYQAFIMLSLVTSFAIPYLFHKGKRIVWLPITLVLLFFILIYPYFSINSYFNNLKDYRGLNGLSYLKTLYPEDYNAILWIQKNIKGQPVMLEAQGDSYTDYERISANTGLPTPLGWTVHEWLWRGSYSIPAGRIDDIKSLYEGDIRQTKALIKKYNISYVYVGTLEKEKYPLLNEEKFLKLGKVVYQNGNTKIYRIYTEKITSG